MVVEKLDYDKLVYGFEYSRRNRLCVWVHPLMATDDLGQEIVDDWKTHLDAVVADDNYCILLLNYISDNLGLDYKESNHARRVQPIIDNLRSLSKDKYLELKDEFFVQTHANIKLLQETFKVKPFFQTAHFLTCEVDGLYRDDCVPTQKKYLECISLFDPKLWKGIRYIDTPKIYQIR